jgi:hypothetical protein
LLLQTKFSGRTINYKIGQIVKNINHIKLLIFENITAAKLLATKNILSITTLPSKYNKLIKFSYKTVDQKTTNINTKSAPTLLSSNDSNFYVGNTTTSSTSSIIKYVHSYKFISIQFQQIAIHDISTLSSHFSSLITDQILHKSVSTLANKSQQKIYLPFTPTLFEEKHFLSHKTMIIYPPVTHPMQQLSTAPSSKSLA